jgi:HSP20 family protein
LEDIMGIKFNGMDFGGAFEDIIQVAREFGEKMKDMGPEMAPYFDCGGHGHREHGERHDFPNVYFYPPTNSYTAADGSLVFEFALAGVDESAVSVTFQGDYLVLNATVAPKGDEGEELRFSRRGFRPRNIVRQKYRVEAEDYAQDQAKAVFKNGVLTVTVPAKQAAGGGIKIEIVKEGN